MSSFSRTIFPSKILIQIIVSAGRGRLNFSLACKHFNYVFRKYFKPSPRQYLRCFQRGRTDAARHIFHRNIFPPNFLNNTPLRKFSEWGDHQVVNILLNEKKSGSAVDPACENNQALRRAVEMGHDKVVSLLIGRNEVDLCFDDNYVMKTCCEKGHDIVLRSLIYRIFDVFHRNFSSKTDSMLFPDLPGLSTTLESSGSIDCSGSSLEEENLDGTCSQKVPKMSIDPVEFVTLMECCFVIGARFGKVKILEALVEIESDPFRRGESSEVESPVEIRIPKYVKNKALGWACRNGYIDCVRYLLKFPDVQPNHLSDHPLRVSSLYGRTEIVKLLLSKKSVDLCSCDHVALVNAVVCGYADIVHLLIKDRRCRDHLLHVIQSNHLLNLASRFGRDELAKYFFQALLDSGEDNRNVNYIGYIEPVLLTCCKYGRINIFQDILHHSTASEIEKFNFEEFFLCSVRYGNIQIVRYIVNHQYESIRSRIFDISIDICHEYRRERINSFLVKRIPDLRKKQNVYYKTKIEGFKGSATKTRKKEREEEIISSNTSSNNVDDIMDIFGKERKKRKKRKKKRRKKNRKKKRRKKGGGNIVKNLFKKFKK